jgi:hypothetical protein
MTENVKVLGKGMEGNGKTFAASFYLRQTSNGLP